MSKYILAIDQGTTSSRTILFDSHYNVIEVAQREFTQHFPQPGWVEHNADDIWQSQLETIGEVLSKTNIHAGDIACIGITNQRETTVAWNRHTGKPYGNAIVWQDRRTAAICEELKKQGLEPEIREKTGLIVDSYFSGTKLHWILKNVDGARAAADSGELIFGTVDAWLLWNLTGRKVHATEVSNASRTMLFNIHTLQWDESLCRALDIPMSVLPVVQDSASDFGVTDASLFGAEIPVYGIAGDQQAALFGQGCFTPGMVKNTYGTGCFMLMNTGDTAIPSKNGMLTTIAWRVNGQTQYALEGSVFIAGAAIQWLRDGLHFFENSKESEEMAMRVPDSGGVYVVPAFAGLGAPYWDMYARGGILGITRGTTNEHITRATLESLAYQTRDILEAMQQDADIKLQALRVDGGATNNNFLMQFQADVLRVPVHRPNMIETTALGAAHLAAVYAGINPIDAINQTGRFRTFLPHGEPDDTEKLYAGWKKAVKRCMKWEE